MVARIRALLAREDGMTLPELLTSMAILGVVLTAIVGVFVSGLHAEVDMNNRFQAQQEARLALSSMRTDIRSACSAAVSSNAGTGVTGDTVALGFCSNSSTTWSSTPVSWATWCIRNEGTHYGLFRESAKDPSNCASPTATTGTREADWLIAAKVTTTPVFVCGFQTTARPQLQVTVPVDASLSSTGGAYTLSDTIMLRNAAVAAPCT
jgi:prepilin-type N-terminal cleavage/methylation domain-containing protein